MLCFFLSDNGLKPRSVVPGVVPTGMGILSDVSESYFVTPSIIDDSRVARLSVLGTEIDGEMTINYDSYIGAAETTWFTALTQTQLRKLFNVVESSVYSTDDDDTLDAAFASDQSNYEGFVTDSLLRSASVSATNVYFVGSTDPVEHSIKDWIQFAFTNGEQAVTIKIWLNNTSFQTDYPFSTVVAVVPPCDPSKLLTANFSNGLESMVSSNQYFATRLAAEIANHDRSGLANYPTQYVTTVYAGEQMIHFSVLYHGVAPTNQVCREAIRDYLLGLDIADADTWKQILPDLFASATFFILPMWDEKTVYPTRVLNHPIVNVASITSLLTSKYPDYPAQFVIDHLEVFHVDSTQLMILAIPAVDNEIKLSLYSEHPTYQAVDGTDPAFDLQTTITKEFNDLLNKCLAQANGENNSGVFYENVFDGKKYLTFTVNFVDYHVFKKVQ